jgi:hypothetical protein
MELQSNRVTEGKLPKVSLSCSLILLDHYMKGKHYYDLTYFLNLRHQRVSFCAPHAVFSYQTF